MKNKIKTYKTKITKENLLLLNTEEQNSEYHLENY